ncbi:MAG: hypothetical protein MIL41_00510 [Hyphomicrobiales bacterium]|jgi:hypothetical protein
MSDPAVMAALPDHLRTLRTQVEEHAPVFGPTAALRWTLLTLLDACEFAARQFAALTPLGAPAQQQVHAQLGDRSPVIEEPLVPRRTGHDPRLPGRRPHP